MAHEGGEVWEFVQGVCAVLVPLVEAMDGEGVAEVVDAGPVFLGEAGFAEEVAEEIEHADAAVLAVFVAEDEVVGTALVGVTEGTAEKEMGESVGGVLGKRDKALLVELGVPEGEGIFVGVEVFEFEVEGLAEAET